MVLETAVLQVRKGLVQDFERDFQLAARYIMSIEGYIRHDLRKCIEVENKFLLMVEWETLEAHTVGFRESAAYEDWKQLLHHYYDPFPTVEHYV